MALIKIVMSFKFSKYSVFSAALSTYSLFYSSSTIFFDTPALL